VQLLLDACIPRRFARELGEHEVRTVPRMGWADLDDGPLLTAIDALFDVFISVDKSLPKQQRLSNRDFATVILRAYTNRFQDLLPLAPTLRQILTEIRSGEVRELEDV
jgi:predicted nuclease of predicted toxin-antitoxin system